MTTTIYDLRVSRQLNVDLTRAHRILNRAMRMMDDKDHHGAGHAEQPNSVKTLPDALQLKHWCLNYIDFGFNARQNSKDTTDVEVYTNVYLSRIPFALTYFELFLKPKLEDQLNQLGILCDALTYRKAPAPQLQFARDAIQIAA